MAEIRIPDLGDFDAVVVVEVHVVDGQEVKENDPIITLETEKAAMDVTAMHKGSILSVSVKSGDRVSTGDVIAQLSDCLLYTSPSPRDLSTSRMPSSA